MMSGSTMQQRRFDVRCPHSVNPTSLPGGGERGRSEGGLACFHRQWRGMLRVDRLRPGEHPPWNLHTPHCSPRTRIVSGTVPLDESRSNGLTDWSLPWHSAVGV